MTALDRRRFLVSAALGGAAVAVGGRTAHASGASDTASTRSAASAAAADPEPVEPTHGAGLFDIDPDQTGVSQSAAVTVSGTASVLPEDWEF